MTLSACNTAAGSKDAEALSGLARASDDGYLSASKIAGLKLDGSFDLNASIEGTFSVTKAPWLILDYSAVGRAKTHMGFAGLPALRLGTSAHSSSAVGGEGGYVLGKRSARRLKTRISERRQGNFEPGLILTPPATLLSLAGTH